MKRNYKHHSYKQTQWGGRPFSWQARLLFVLKTPFLFKNLPFTAGFLLLLLGIVAVLQAVS